MTLYYKMLQILFQNVTAMLLQNAPSFLLQNEMVYKIRQLLQNAKILLQNTTVVAECIASEAAIGGVL